jgi:hypothetical protein
MLVTFFALAVLLVRGCERIIGADASEVAPSDIDVATEPPAEVAA